MRESYVVTDIWCDMHEGDRESATTTFTITMDEGKTHRSKPRVVDVCEVHAKPFRETLTFLRRLPHSDVSSNEEGGDNTRGSRPRDVTCPCGSVVGRPSFPAHCVAVHHVKPLTQPKKCPDCDYRHDEPHSMVLHRSGRHGYDHIVEWTNLVTKKRG